MRQSYFYTVHTVTDNAQPKSQNLKPWNWMETFLVWDASKKKMLKFSLQEGEKVATILKDNWTAHWRYTNSKQPYAYLEEGKKEEIFVNIRTTIKPWQVGCTWHLNKTKFLNFLSEWNRGETSSFIINKYTCN